MFPSSNVTSESGRDGILEFHLEDFHLEAVPKPGNCSAIEEMRKVREGNDRLCEMLCSDRQKMSARFCFCFCFKMVSPPLLGKNQQRPHEVPLSRLGEHGDNVSSPRCRDLKRQPSRSRPHFINLERVSVTLSSL